MNGGNDLIYFPQGNGKELAPKVVKALLAQDYTVGRVRARRSRGASRHAADECRRPERRRAYADAVDRGELPLRDDRLRPAAVLRVTVTDGTLLQGQGHHGSFSRADTANFMAAIGPAFKAGFVNEAPVSNADIAPTLAQVDRREARAGRRSCAAA